MPLLEDGRITADAWVRVEDDAVLPDSPAIVSLARLPQVGPRSAPLGVALPPDAPAASLAPWLDRLALVVLTLPKFRDGRAFTQARALREQLGFKGEIRAAGHVIPDQYLALLRCGVTTVEVPEGTDPTPWEAARHLVGIAYQPSLIPEAPLSLLRRKLALA